MDTKDPTKADSKKWLNWAKGGMESHWKIDRKLKPTSLTLSMT